MIGAMDVAPMRIGIIGGSGLGDALGVESGRRCDLDTPFGAPSSPIVLTAWSGVEIAILQRHGEGHLLSPDRVPYRANIFALKQLGVTHVVASGATGSLREQIKPGHLVVPDQAIDKTHGREATFYEGAAVHVEMANPFCPVMRRWLLAASERLEDTTVHGAGTYVCMQGPAFSTRAESLMHRSWGGDLIGMTCMPEAKLAREAEMAYALVALPTDFDCWRPRADGGGAEELLAEIIGNLEAATAASIRLIRTALDDVALLTEAPSPSHDALKLAIWSDKSKIDPVEIERLAPLWGRYF